MDEQLILVYTYARMEQLSKRSVHDECQVSHSGWGERLQISKGEEFPMTPMLMNQSWRHHMNSSLASYKDDYI